MPKPSPEDWERHCKNLLACIHRDGGHHLEAVGLEQAVEDADSIVACLHGLADEQKQKQKG